MKELFLQPLNILAQGSCGNFFGFPTWYKYLPKGSTCNPEFSGLNDLWLIVLALIEILLRIAVLVAIAYVLLGGFKYITSRGNPDRTSTARNTVQDGLIGLVITVIAVAIVAFVARQMATS